MKSFSLSRILIIIISIIFSGSVLAGSMSVTVDGAAAPYDSVKNPQLRFGVDVNGVPNSNAPPKVVRSEPHNNLDFGRGQIISIVVKEGRPIAGANGSAIGVGGAGVPGWPPSVAPCNTAPGCYTGSTTYLEQLLGAWTDQNGIVLGVPFIIGDGIRNIMAPKGAKQLQLGFNDAWYNDNGGSITVVVETKNPCPKAGDSDVVINSYPRSLILPINTTPGLTVNALADIATRLEKPIDGILRGWTTPVKEGKRASLAQPKVSATFFSGPAGGDLPGACYFVDNTILNYLESIQIFIADADVQPACAFAIATHEARHAQEFQTWFAIASTGITTDLMEKLPSAKFPIYVESEAGIKRDFDEIIREVILKNSGPANNDAADWSRNWDLRDYPRVDAVCRLIRR